MSDGIIIDLGHDEPEETLFDLLPAGYAKAVPEKVEYATSKVKGTPSVHITWRCIEPVPYAARVIFDDLWLNMDKTFNLNRLKNVLKAVGAPYKGGKMDLEVIMAKIRDGGYVFLKIDIEHDKTGEYDSKNRVKGYRALDNPPPMGLGPSAVQPKPPAMPNSPSADDVDLGPDLNMEDDDDLLT